MHRYSENARGVAISGSARKSLSTQKDLDCSDYTDQITADKNDGVTNRSVSSVLANVNMVLNVHRNHKAC